MAKPWSSFPCFFFGGIPCLLLWQGAPFCFSAFSLLSQEFEGSGSEKNLVLSGHCPCKPQVCTKKTDVRGQTSKRRFSQKTTSLSAPTQRAAKQQQQKQQQQNNNSSNNNNNSKRQLKQTTQTDSWCNIFIALVLSRFCLSQWKRYFRCGISSSQRWRQTLSLSPFWRSYFRERFEKVTWKWGQRKVPKFFKISTRILLRKMLRIFPEIFEDFSCFVSWETETTKHSPKIPTVIQCQISRQIERKNSQNFSGERAKQLKG